MPTTSPKGIATQDAPLLLETPVYLVAAAGDDLDRDLLLEGIVVADGVIDHAHAAAAELGLDPVGAQPLAGEVVEGLEGRAGGSLEEPPGLGVRVEQRVDLGTQLRVAAGRVQKRPRAPRAVARPPR